MRAFPRSAPLGPASGLWEGAVYLLCWHGGLRSRWAVEEPLGWSLACLGPGHVVLIVT